ncbi:hypothetical protein AMS68_005953 [Peltaster fructicola]|uniref:Zn(2)-C6 fungal-type domain-containing protein n=1 Tax=Peltaster fructicola TaxID=286661 RepID=A0A6H0Y0H9_9PEZI|nr:hypothetical protein AMS68_005953 [Peltaster fructicola]
MSDLYTILANDAEPRQGSPPPTSDLSEPARKRPRVNQACETCRDRKTRCGGERPVCLACERRGVGSSCSYDRSTVKRKASSRGPSELVDQYQTTPSQGERQTTHYPVTSGFAPINRNIDFARSQTAQRPSLPHVVDRAIDTPETQSRDSINGVYGPSSTVAFMHTIADEPVNTVDPQPLVLGQRKSASARVNFRPPEKMFVSDGSQTLLPRRRDADDYVRCFWEYIHPLFPVLHKQSFMHQYEQLWSAENDPEQPEFDETMFMSALNIVFAIGCRSSKLVPNDHKVSLADEFYQRSRRTFCYDVLDTATISMMQLLLLIVVYLQSTHHAVRCWNAIGLAVRAGQSIGLHMDSTIDSERSQLQTEMRRRIWHTCISLDRVVAMVFGRPAATQKTDLPLPSMIDDEYLSEDIRGVQPREQLPKLGLFNYSCLLFDILEDILSTFYTGNTVTSERNAEDEAHSMVTAVIGFTKRIDNFVAKVPEWLLVEHDLHTDSHVRLQQRVLRSRILYVRLLSTRPLLMLATSRRLLTKSRARALEDDVIRSCCVRCLGTAQDLISETHAHLMESHRSSAWHTTVFTCASLMVLLATIKSCQVAADDAEIHKSWEQAINILEYYQDQVPPAAEGIRMLQTLKRQLLADRKPAGTLKRPECSYAADSAPEKTVNAQLGHVQTPVSVALEPSDEMDVGELGIGFDDITDAWLSQHFFDTNWLEIPSW